MDFTAGSRSQGSEEAEDSQVPFPTLMNAEEEAAHFTTTSPRDVQPWTQPSPQPCPGSGQVSQVQADATCSIPVKD